MIDHLLSDAVRAIGAAFEKRAVPHALIGGLAFALRGRPRSTKDADFIVNCPALTLPALLEDLKSDGFEIDVMDFLQRWPADKFIVFKRGKVRIDWMQPILPIYANVLRSAKQEHWKDQSLRVVTAEGLILTKLLAFRQTDQTDIETVLIANRETIDLSIIRDEWAAFAKSEADRTAWLEAAIAKHVTPYRSELSS